MFANIALERFDDVLAFAGIQIGRQTPQRKANDVPVMELRAEIFLRAQTQPDVVQAIDIFRPEAGRVGTEVDVGGWPVGADDFEEKGCRGSGNRSHASPMRRANSSEAIRSETPVTSFETFRFVAV